MEKIAIFGTPRSGTSWIGHIFNSHPDVALRFQPLFSYGHKGMLTPFSSNLDIDQFFNSILHSEDDFATMKAESQKNYPKFSKSSFSTHIVFKETRYLNIIENMLEKTHGVKVIGIVRNPLAVLASWIHAPNEFKDSWNVFDEWEDAPSKNLGLDEEYFGYNKWKVATNNFLKLARKFPKNFYLVTYNQLNNDTTNTVSDLFKFCKLSLCDQVIDFLQESKSRHDPDPYSVYRSKANDDNWKNVLPNEIVVKVTEDLRGSDLETFIQN